MKDLLKPFHLELSIKAKNGINFIMAASIVWGGIAIVWLSSSLDFFGKSIYTFWLGALMLPLAFVFSKILQTTWTIKENPLDSLGLILNFAQLFYFPFVFFFLSKSPEYFLMGYAIITGAHFFPYSWYYQTQVYTVGAIMISVGSFLIAILLPATEFFWIAVLVAGVLGVMTVFLWRDVRKKIAILGNN